jgi:putative FmdB family regulatory protein
MPTYEYACTQCGQRVEVFQRISEAPLTTCGVCGGQLRKVFHPAGILFKGSGFYSTDNRSSSTKPAASEPKPAALESKGESPTPGTTGSGGGSKATAASEKTA